MNKWIRRIAIAGTTAALGLAPAGVATAQDTGYAPITISPDQVKKLCEERVPRIEDRITRLTTRIDGGPEVAGSTAWLKAQSQKAHDSGDTARAERLDRRLERRAGQQTRLDDARARVDKFRTGHCGTGK